jgi:hypothetical protein
MKASLIIAVAKYALAPIMSHQVIGATQRMGRRSQMTTTRQRFASWLILISLILLLSVPVTGQSPSSQSILQERIASIPWNAVRGVNYIPSYSANSYEMWMRYDHDTFDRELRLASDVGYNSVRLWLNYAAYQELGSKMIEEVEDAVRLCAKYHLRAVVVLFDSCGIRPRPDTQWLLAPEAYEWMQSSSRFTIEQRVLMKRLFNTYVHGFGAHTMVPVASDTPMMALLYQKWVPTPGNDRLGEDWYPKLEQYVDAIVGASKNNPTILLWDLMNEPEWASEGPLSPTEIITPEMKRVRDAFLRHFYTHIKERFPAEIVGVGWAALANAETYSRWSDVVTFHVYGAPERIQSAIEKAEAFSRSSGKTVLITETLANWDFDSPDFGKLATDEQQLTHYERVLPVLLKSPIGWLGWGLVMSHDFNPFTDIFYADGQARPAAIYLEKALKQSPSRQLKPSANLGK